MENETFISCIVKSSRRIREVYDEIISKAAHKCGLTRPEADVLLFLYNNPDYKTARDIAIYRGLSKAYVSKAVEPLTEKGMLAIECDPHDRRRQILTITGGLEAAETLRAAQKRFVAWITTDIPKEDIARFMSVTNAMATNALSIDIEA